MANPLAQLTLTAATVATFTLDADYPKVEVLNVTGTAALYFTTDGTAPTVGGAGCYVVAGVAGASLQVRSIGSGDVVKVISSGTPAVSVRGVSA